MLLTRAEIGECERLVLLADRSRRFDLAPNITSVRSMNHPGIERCIHESIFVVT